MFAMGWLILTGHLILAWRWRCHVGAVDLIARRGRKLLFIEVKYRRRHGQPGIPNHRQMQRILRAAEAFAKQRRISPDFEWRFDLLQLAWPDRQNPWFLRHIRNAWDASSRFNRRNSP